MDGWQVIALIFGSILSLLLIVAILGSFYRRIDDLSDQLTRIDYLSDQLTITNKYLESLGQLLLITSADVRVMKSKLLPEEPQGNQWDISELFSDDEKWQG